MRMPRELSSNARSRPQRQLGNDSDIGIRCKRLRNIAGKVRASRQRLPTLWLSVGSETTSPLRPAGTHLKQGERDTRLSLRVNIVYGESSVASEPNRRSLDTRQRGHLDAAQVRPTRQILGKASICRQDHPVNNVRRQRRILGQTIESTMHKTIVPVQRPDGQHFMGPLASRRTANAH